MVTALRKALVDENMNNATTPSPRRQPSQGGKGVEELKTEVKESVEFDLIALLLITSLSSPPPRIRPLKVHSSLLLRLNLIALLVTLPQGESIIWSRGSQ
jgi:hypothetical protein